MFPTVDLNTEYPCSPNFNQKGCDVLHILAMDGDTVLISKYLSLHPEKVDILNGSDWTPLLVACRNSNGTSNPESVQILLEAGATVNSQDEDGWSSLFLASRHSGEETVELLLEYGADINLETTSGETPLYAAFQSTNTKTIELLFKRGAGLSLETYVEKSPLYAACASNCKVNVKLLLQRGVSTWHERKDFPFMIRDVEREIFKDNERMREDAKLTADRLEKLENWVQFMNYGCPGI